MNFAAPELNFNSLWRESREAGDCERLSVGAECGEETPGVMVGTGAWVVTSLSSW